MKQKDKGSWLIMALMVWALFGSDLGYSDTLVIEAESATENRDLLQEMDRRLKEIRLIRERLHEWDRAVRGFRMDHNFTVIAGMDLGVWSGYVASKDVPFDIRSNLPFIALQYSFHIPILRTYGIGYYAGSRARFYAFEHSVEELPNARLYGLPSATGGFVWNISPGLRVHIGADAALLRVEDFASPEVIDSDELSATAQVLSYKAGMDIFFTLASGISVEYEQYELRYDSGSNVSLRRHGNTWSLAFVWHLI